MVVVGVLIVWVVWVVGVVGGEGVRVWIEMRHNSKVTDNDEDQGDYNPKVAHDASTNIQSKNKNQNQSNKIHKITDKLCPGTINFMKSPDRESNQGGKLFSTFLIQGVPLVSTHFRFQFLTFLIILSKKSNLQF